MSEPTIRYSNLTLYKDCKILPFKNFILGSNISNHLSTLTSISITNFQWLRNTLDLVIKINKTEEFTAMLLSNNYNYLKVDQDSKIYYYYVIRKTQLAQSTIQLELRMDVLNTFQWDTDFKPTNKTKVLREHKDRYTKIENKVLVWPTDPAATFAEIEVNDDIDNNYDSQTNITQVEFDFTDLNLDTWTADAIELWNSLEELNFKVVLEGVNGTIPNELIKTINIAVTTPVLGAYVEVSGQIEIWGDNPVSVIYIDPYGYKGVEAPKLIKKIDLYSEGIHGNLYKKELGELNPPERSNWYLIYKNNAEATPENPEPLNCYLAPESSLEVKYESENVVDHNTIPAGKMIIFATQGAQFEKPITISFNGTSLTTNGYTAGLELQYVGVAIGLNGDNPSKLDVYYILWRYGEILGIPYYRYEQLGLWQSVDSVDVLSEQSPIKYYVGTTIPDYIGDVLINRNYSLARSTYTAKLKSFAELDRTDVLLNKIINIPYLPQDYTFDANKLVFSDDWTYDAGTGFMKLKNLNVKFTSKIQSAIPSPITTKLSNLVYADVVGTEVLRNIDLEPKLLHSDYYNIKFIYDSFSFVFQLEKMDIEEYQALNIENFEFTFVMTTTINSKFLFKFDFYKLLYSTEDFDNILPVARNNEAVIYNSPYLNYLRIAYNYDLKAKERTLALAGIGGAFSGISQIAGTGLALASGNPAVATRGLISGSTGVVSTILNTINTFISAEEDFAKNLDLLKTQSVSVAGSDDLDLMKAYCNNQAKLCEYEVSPRLKQALFDLFHYTGYISGEMKKPNVNTRYWFNFLACELVIDSNYANIPEICLDELKRLYAEGVTFLHYHTKFDFDQKWENWENSILNS